MLWRSTQHWTKVLLAMKKPSTIFQRWAKLAFGTVCVPWDSGMVRPEVSPTYLLGSQRTRRFTRAWWRPCEFRSRRVPRCRLLCLRLATRSLTASHDHHPVRARIMESVAVGVAIPGPALVLLGPQVISSNSSVHALSIWPGPLYCVVPQSSSLSNDWRSDIQTRFAPSAVVCIQHWRPTWGSNPRSWD